MSEHLYSSAAIRPYVLDRGGASRRSLPQHARLHVVSAYTAYSYARDHRVR
ncbi:MAG: hypothetical protein M3Q49_22590 [Actinomycetota bacterium]|nr:hypothetical protein [Actinomycetota bacterium]